MILPVVVTLPILSLLTSVNQMALSGAVQNPPGIRHVGGTRVVEKFGPTVIPNGAEPGES